MRGRKVLCVEISWVGKDNARLAQMSEWEFKGEAMYVILRSVFILRTKMRDPESFQRGE